MLAPCVICMFDTFGAVTSGVFMSFTVKLVRIVLLMFPIVSLVMIVMLYCPFRLVGSAYVLLYLFVAPALINMIVVLVLSGLVKLAFTTLTAMLSVTFALIVTVWPML